MNTDIHTFKPADLLAKLAVVAPSISIETVWEHDLDCSDITKDCDMPADTDPDEWQAWQSEVRATAIINGKEVSGSDYLGGTWEEYGDDPAKTNPEISGYLPQMILEAVKELGKQIPTGHPAQKEINAILSAI